jgi:hypothetical protein
LGGSGSRTPALQVQSLEFKLQYCKKKVFKENSIKFSGEKKSLEVKYI